MVSWQPALAVEELEAAPETRKEVLYERVVNAIDQRLPDIMQELDMRLAAAMDAMLSTIRENFAKNVRAVVGRLKG